jgi:hypothetical protein
VGLPTESHRGLQCCVSWRAHSAVMGKRYGWQETRFDGCLGVLTSCGKGLLRGFGGTYCLTLQGDCLGHVDAEVIERMCGIYRNF